MKAPKKIASERTKRRAHIRRGIKIALYEVRQILAAHGMALDVPPGFVDYTTAIAEAGRRGATVQDQHDAIRETLSALLWRRVAIRL